LSPMIVKMSSFLKDTWLISCLRATAAVKSGATKIRSVSNQQQVS
jgi:hypothetical protein